MTSVRKGMTQILVGFLNIDTEMYVVTDYDHSRWPKLIVVGKEKDGKSIRKESVRKGLTLAQAWDEAVEFIQDNDGSVLEPLPRAKRVSW